MDFTQPERPSRVKDLVGVKSGLLTVTEFLGMRGKFSWWKCRCECGKEDVMVPAANISSGNTKSCGCLKRQPAVNRFSTEQFISMAVEKHGDKYDYSQVDYKGMVKRVTIVCPIHGAFQQRAEDHLNSGGCQECNKNSRTAGQTSCTPEFIQRATSIHKGKYTYELVKYKTARIKVEITCKTHGSFFQVPDSHLKGRGCPTCARRAMDDKKRSSKEEFIEKAVATHGDKYEYSRVVYTTARKPVEILCKTHDKYFWQVPHAHLIGGGCPACAQAGFDTTKPGIFYVLKSPDYVKVGITNISAESRAKSISRSAFQSFDIIKTYEMDGITCNDLENKMLRWLRGFAPSPIVKFEGYTEAFCVGVADVLNKVEEYLNV